MARLSPTRPVAAMASRKDLPGMAADPRFWASGDQPRGPYAQPARACRPHEHPDVLDAAWLAGSAAVQRPQPGAGIPYEEDTAHFHNRMMARACESHGPWDGEDRYAKLKAWADTYFFVPHRGRARGVGGIFYDDLNTGDWEADFAFTADVGRHFRPAFLPLVDKRRNTPWTEADKDAQLVHRGLYAEYNLVYDRGTKFGLETGHDADAVLMSLPPLAKWH